MKKGIPGILLALGIVSSLQGALTPSNPHFTSEFDIESAPTDPFSIRAGGSGTVGYIDNGSWFGFTAIDVGELGVQNMTVEVASPETGCILTIHSGSATGPILGTLAVPATGGFNDFQECHIALNQTLSGVSSLFFTFSGGGGYLVDTRAFWFTPVAPGQKQVGSVFQAGIYDSESHPDIHPVVSANGEIQATTAGTWVAYHDFDFSGGVNEIEVEAAAAGKAGLIEVRTGSPSGPLVTEIPVNHTGSLTHFRRFRSRIDHSPSGIQDLYLHFVNSNDSPEGSTLFHLRRLSLYSRTETSSPIPTSARLNVYPPVPGLSPSPYYRFEVQKMSDFNSADKASNTNWLSPFAWLTQCIEKTPENKGSAYFEEFIGSWSHTYCNFEVDPETPIVVKITRLDKPGAPSGPIQSAVVKPLRDGVTCEVINGEVYVTLQNPGLFAVDIDGQIESRDAPRAIPDTWTGPFAPYTTEATAAHSLSIFANPVIEDKPSLSDPGVFQVEPGTMPPHDGPWHTLYFKPGIHKFSVDAQGNEREWEITDPLPLVNGKSYYIPGDAIVYGNLSDYDDDLASKDIRVFGHGTLSGKKIPHFENFLNPDYPLSFPEAELLTPWRRLPPGSNGRLRMISLSKAGNCHYEGITIADPPEHGFRMIHEGVKGNSLRWLKNLSWRVNNDAASVGGKAVVEDCFFRHQDDGLYIGTYAVRRCVFWTDVNGIPLRCSFINRRDEEPLFDTADVVIEDCEVIYARSVFTFSENPGAGIICYPGGPANGTFRDGTRNTSQHIVFRNLKVTDPRPQRFLLGFEGDRGDSNFAGWAGIRFENVHYQHPHAWGWPNMIFATESGPAKFWTFDNVTIGGSALDRAFFENPSGFETENSSEMIFRVKEGHRSLTTPTSPFGTIARNSVGPLYVEGSPIKLTATPRHGFVFSSWGGDLDGSSENPITVVMNTDKVVTANFQLKPPTAINCGGGAVVSSSGINYQDDAFYSGSSTFSTSSVISGTDDQDLYRSERWGGEFTYAIPVTNGPYEVTLKFAEIFMNSAGQRVFDVSIEDYPAILGLDIFSKVGKNAAYDETHTTIVDDGFLNIRFSGRVDNAKISSILLKPVIVGAYSEWAATFAGGQSESGDFDQDGISNGIEYFTGVGNGSPLFTLSGTTITWPKSNTALARGIVEVSEDLVDWQAVTSGVVEDQGSISYALAMDSPSKFVRLRVVTSP
jgi:hypothetical protein